MIIKMNLAFKRLFYFLLFFLSECCWQFLNCFPFFLQFQQFKNKVTRLWHIISHTPPIRRLIISGYRQNNQYSCPCGLDYHQENNPGMNWKSRNTRSSSQPPLISIPRQNLILSARNLSPFTNFIPFHPFFEFEVVVFFFNLFSVTCVYVLECSW